MKKLKPVYLIICILMILFFCTSCFFTQCSKSIAGLVATAISTESNGFLDSNSSQSGEISSLNENDTGLANNTSEETVDFGDSLDGMDSPSDWEDYNLSGISGDIIDFKIVYEFVVPGDTGHMVFTTCVPKDYRYRQKIKDYGFSVRPDRIFTDDGNKYAMFNLIKPAGKFFISIDIQMELFDFDLLAAQKILVNLLEDKSLFSEYLVSEDHLEADDLGIKETAESITGTDQLGIVSQIYSFVLDRMQYSGYNPSDLGAAAALANGSGDCTEYSDLFVALCRVKGIPARVIEGYTTDSGPGNLSLGHNWAEVYLDNFGWVPFDPIYDDNNGSSTETTFENLKNIYVYTGFKRNDAILSGYHYYAYNYYGDAVEVKKTVAVN